MKIHKSDNLRRTSNRAKRDLSVKNGISPPNAVKKRRVGANSTGKSTVGRQLKSPLDQSELLRAKSLEILRLTRALKQSEKNLRGMTAANEDLNAQLYKVVGDLNVQLKKNSTLKRGLGAAKAQLRRYQNQLKNALDTELKCAICADRMIEAVVSGVCGHSFCKSCIDRWMQEKRRCPTCRSICYRTAPAVAIQQLHEKLLDCLDAESRQKYAEAVQERKSEPPIVAQPNPNSVVVGRWTDLFFLPNNTDGLDDDDEPDETEIFRILDLIDDTL